MKFPLLLEDELRGFYKSKVMLFLWIGLPIITILFRFIQSSIEGQEIPFAVISTLIVSSLAGTLASVMLTVSIINEKNRHVYELFLIRPLKRQNIILAKFFAVYICVAIASFISVLTGIAADYISTGALSVIALDNIGQSLTISLSVLAIACSAGALIGIASPSVLVGAILVIYGGNQISFVPLIPTILNLDYANLITVGIAIALATALLVIAITLFERKQF